MVKKKFDVMVQKMRLFIMPLFLIFSKNQSFFRKMAFSYEKHALFTQVVVAKKILFFYKRKLWVIPVKTNRIWIFYDKNSILWLVAIFFEKSDFFDFLQKNLKKVEKMWFFRKNRFFWRKISRDATESSFYRKKFIHGLFWQELPNVCVYRKIKFFSQQQPW